MLRQILLLRARLHSPTARAVVARHRPWCSATTDSPSKVIPSTTFNLRDQKWRDNEEEILRDIEPIVLLAKDILFSPRYMDGQVLNVAEEKAIVDKLLAYHPDSEDKIGCGLESIMVDRHPEFGYSRCLFVVRTDGVWIDFSYKWCLQNYIRDKYPIHAERFIQKHFKDNKCLSKYIKDKYPALKERFIR
ncbi:protein DCL homolog, chloroplastic-like [Lotus japonicus]|uniref:protein DCL homolog, chloroplastic-like n=1 Tax=Lotus japonicus TaxID=34305 RepID=UPI0025896410|nr:protein DCL homolog, chloroplastic-like [Lotus japonicus]XP_057429419.1 protein DCL homolog, chloroplastic-like [Lotus japonicus]